MSRLIDSQTLLKPSNALEFLFYTFPRLLVCGLPLFLILGPAPTDVAVSAVALLFVLRSVVTKDWSWTQSLWLKVALGIWLYLILSNLIIGTASGIKTSLVWGRFILFAAALENLVLTESVWRKRLLWSIGAVIIFTGLDTIYQYFRGTDLLGHPILGYTRLTGPFLKPKVGIFLVKLGFPAILALASWAIAKKRFGYAIALSILFTFLGAVFLSGERMALLLALFGAGLTLFLLPTWRKFILTTILLTVVSVTALTFVTPNLEQRFIAKTMQEFKNPLESPYQALFFSAFTMSKHHPLFGVGLRQFRKQCPNPIYGTLETRYSRCSTHPHHYYVQWLVETGVIGLLGFLFLIGVWFQHLYRNYSHIKNDPVIAGLTITLLLQLWPIGSTGSFFNNWNSALFWLILGALLAYIPTKTIRNS